MRDFWDQYDVPRDDDWELMFESVCALENRAACLLLIARNHMTNAIPHLNKAKHGQYANEIAADMDAWLEELER